MKVERRVFKKRKGTRESGEDTRQVVEGESALYTYMKMSR
jgi:hypothetical protein